MILVTGGTGLVGAHLLLHLLENGADRVRTMHRDPKNINKTKLLFELYEKGDLFLKIEWVSADILDVPSLEIAFQNVDYVYHCAAFISFNPEDEEDLRKANIEGTANIINFCIDKKIKKLCHVSSIAALGDLVQNHSNQKDEQINQNTIDEETEWNPEYSHSDYAISKYGAEMEVWRGFQEGLPIIIVNPGVVFGPGFYNQGSGVVFNSIKKGFPFYTNGTTGYVSVVDVVSIMYKLMNSNCSGERFIVISENCTYKNILSTIAKKLGAKIPNIKAKPWLLNLAWRLDWLAFKVFRTKRKLSKHSIQSLQNTDVYSNEKIIKQLNYSFQDIDSYLEEVVRYFKK